MLYRSMNTTNYCNLFLFSNPQNGANFGEFFVWGFDVDWSNFGQKVPKKQHLSHHNSSHKILNNKVKYEVYRCHQDLSFSSRTTCLMGWVWRYSLLKGSLFLLIYGLTMGTRPLVLMICQNFHQHAAIWSTMRCGCFHSSSNKNTLINENITLIACNLTSHLICIPRAKRGALPSVFYIRIQ